MTDIAQAGTAGITDNPITRSSEDLLQRDDVAAALAENLRYVDAWKGHVVGILGPWGSGKTSLVNLVRERLAASPELPVLDFNPWMFSSAEQLVESFFTELAAQLRVRGGRFQRIAERLDSYGELLTPLGLVPFLGAWTERLRGATGALKRYQDKRKHGLGERRQQLVEELFGLEQPIVVVLDDIDRLTTGEIREIFKLVRLTASFPNVIYLLAFDRRRVEQALSDGGIDGRHYLEKIVQTVVDVPAVPRDLLLQSLGSALNDVVNAASAAQRFDSDRWPDLLFEVIWPRITNMRDVRRLAASVYAAVRGLRDEVELVDVLALEAIRVFMPDTFAAISGGREGLTTTGSLGFGQDQVSPAQTAEVQAVVAAATHEGSADAAKAIIERLFPAATRHTSNTHYGSDWEKQWLRARRVAHKDVLQLYLERNASENLAAFRDAERALAVAHDERQLEDYFRGIKPERLEKVITALEVYEGELPSESIVPLSTVLFNLMPSIPDRPRGMLDFLEPRIIVSRVVLRALRQLQSPEAVQAVVDNILPKLTQLSAEAQLVQLVGHQEGAGHGLVSEEAAEAYEESLARRVEEAPPEELAEEGDLLRLLLAAEQTTGRSPLPPPRITPGLTVAVLLSAAGEVKSQSSGSRAVRRSPRLPWDLLTSLYGGEDQLRRALDETRDLPSAPPNYADLLSLADKYASGWRPKEFGQPFDEND